MFVQLTFDMITSPPATVSVGGVSGIRILVRSTAGVTPPMPGQPTSVGSSMTKKVAKPPPPVHKSVASVSPSSAKSHGSFKGSPSRGGSSRESDWSPYYTQFRDWQQRRWYH